MDNPIKDNTHILADKQAFIDVCNHAREVFRKIEGVVDVGMGQKETHGEYQDDIAIVVFVHEKKAAEELAPEQRIPSTFQGYRTDVTTVRWAYFNSCENTREYAKIQGGIQIVGRADPVTGQYEKGTLGCIVRKRGDTSRENIYLLSNKHVLFAHDAEPESYIYHPYAPPPAPKFIPAGPANVLGPLQKESFYENTPFVIPGDSTPTDFFVDCAIARIDIDSNCTSCKCTKDRIEVLPESITDLQVNGVDTISDVRSVINDPDILNKKVDVEVFKVGRTTGKTTGIVRKINTPVKVPEWTVSGSSQFFIGSNTIEIDFVSSAGAAVNCKGNKRFAEVGDSGAVVVDKQGRVIGLHSLGATPNSPSEFPTYACHILPVLDSLGICIPTTTGSSYGSCRATDGSGTASVTNTSAERVAEMTHHEVHEPQRIAVTEEELEHLLRLRDEFRQTPKGRALYDLFGQVRREIGYLIRNSRRVKVAWHRGQGPAFLAHTINQLRGRSDVIPLEVNGVPRAAFLSRMAQVLAAHGSNPLRTAIERYQDELMPILCSAGTVQECMALFRSIEAVAATDADRAPELAASAGERGASSNDTLGG